MSHDTRDTPHYLLSHITRQMSYINVRVRSVRMEHGRATFTFRGKRIIDPRFDGALKYTLSTTGIVNDCESMMTPCPLKLTLNSILEK